MAAGMVGAFRSGIRPEAYPIAPPLAVKLGVPIVREEPSGLNALDRWSWANALFLIGPANEDTRLLMEKELARGTYVKTYAHWARTHTLGQDYF